MIYTGKHIDAQTALRYGLVNRVVPAEALLDEAKALMDDILKVSPMVAPDKKTLKKSVKSMFFMVQTRCEVETIKY